LRNVKLRHLVKQLAIVCQTLKTVRKSAGDIDQAPILCGKFKSFPTTERRRIPANIDHDVEHAAGGTTNQLNLGFWVGLVVKTPQHAWMARERQIALRPVSVQLLRGKFLFTISPSQKSALIFPELWINDPNAGK